MWSDKTEDPGDVPGWHLPLKTRAYLYRVATGVVPLLTGYGLIADSKAALWVGLAGVLLGIGGHGLASANTSTKG